MPGRAASDDRLDDFDIEADLAGPRVWIVRVRCLANETTNWLMILSSPPAMVTACPLVHESSACLRGLQW